MSNKPVFPLARIKRLMQADDDVGQIRAPVLPIVSDALAGLANAIVDAAALQAKNADAKTIQPEHMCATASAHRRPQNPTCASRLTPHPLPHRSAAAVRESEQFAFLRETVEGFTPSSVPAKRSRGGERSQLKRPTKAASVSGVDANAEAEAAASLGADNAHADAALRDCNDDYD